MTTAKTKTKRECKAEGCAGNLMVWLRGHGNDLYRCLSCGQVHKWDGTTLVLERDWKVPATETQPRSSR